MPLNITACINLHNEIVRRGWEGAMNQPFDSALFRPFWNQYQAWNKAIRTVATEDTIEFYKNALVISGGRSLDDAYQNFFYYLDEVTHPSAEHNYEMLRSLNGEAENRYIMLYSTTLLASRGAGLILDQKTGKAIVQQTMFSSQWDDPLLQWQQLEVLLASFVNMIEMNKVVARDFKAEKRAEIAQGLPRKFGMADVQHPWKFQSYSAKIVDATVVAFEQLIQAIERRMPSPHVGAGNEEWPATEPLSTSQIMDAAGIPKSCFARDFLTRAGRPKDRRLQFIAPGLSLPSPESLTAQPFQELSRQYPHTSTCMGEEFVMETSDDENPLYPPFLIFPGMNLGDGATKDALSRTTVDADEKAPFGWPFDSLRELTSGLYLDQNEPWSHNAFEDASVLLLPFALGGPDGHAMYNDLAPLEGRSKNEPSKSELYQTRVNPFVMSHGTQLHLILDSWTEMVERGHWDVYERGVTGGMQRFREADQSAELAKRYTAILHW